MQPTLSPEEIRDANTRYHDVAAGHYDAKWGIDDENVLIEGAGDILELDVLEDE